MLPRVNMVRCDNADYLLFSSPDSISDTIYRAGTWAEPLIAMSRMFYADVASPLILDVGANLGGYCIPIAKEIAGAGGSVYAFEPQRIVFYQLCGNAFLNRLDNIHAFMMAIGEDDGMINIPDVDYGASTNIGAFSLDENIRNTLNAIKFVGQIGDEVRISRLDSLTLPKSPCLIKIDVEGLELKVLRGGRKFLHDNRYPPILLEAWQLDWFVEQRLALFGFLHELGYTTFEIGQDVVAQHPAFDRFVEFRVDAGMITMQRTK
jgi:FkbM family methyltransferase